MGALSSTPTEDGAQGDSVQGTVVGDDLAALARLLVGAGMVLTDCTVRA